MTAIKPLGNDDLGEGEETMTEATTPEQAGAVEPLSDEEFADWNRAGWIDPNDCSRLWATVRVDRERIARLRAELRGHLVMEGRCDVCYGRWLHVGPEQHEPDCLAQEPAK